MDGRTRLHQTSLIALAIAAVLGAGCGDDESDALSKQEYIAKASASCVKGARKAEAAFARIIGGERRTPEVAQRFLAEAVVPIFREGIEQRAKLPAPEGDGKQIEAINAAGQRALAGFEHAAADPSSAAALMRGQTPDPAKEVDALNRRYGVEKCGGDQ